jgi:putative membrane protein (TIGR04086 family)
MKGLLCAVALTLLLMVGVAAAALKLRVSDGMLTALNQVMKLLSILLGVAVAVGPGGRRGFLTGMTVAMLYMTAGYICYVALGGNAFVVGQMLGEILIGAALGAVAGAVLSNLPSGRQRRTA